MPATQSRSPLISLPKNKPHHSNSRYGGVPPLGQLLGRSGGYQFAMRVAAADAVMRIAAADDPSKHPSVIRAALQSDVLVVALRVLADAGGTPMLNADQKRAFDALIR